MWATFPGGWVRTHPEAREKLFEFSEEASAPLTLNVDQLDSRRVTTGQFLDGESLFWEDSWREGDPWVFKGRPWVRETRFYVVGHGSEGSWRSTVTEPVFHIVEAPGGIDKMAEETPTERYYCAQEVSGEAFSQGQPIPPGSPDFARSIFGQVDRFWFQLRGG